MFRTVLYRLFETVKPCWLVRIYQKMIAKVRKRVGGQQISSDHIINFSGQITKKLPSRVMAIDHITWDYDRFLKNIILESWQKEEYMRGKKIILFYYILTSR